MKYALLEFAIHEVREDLELAVRVGSEPGISFDPVLVQDAQVPKTRMITIAIPKYKTKTPYQPKRSCGIQKTYMAKDSRSKGERVEGFQPTVVSMASLG